MKGFKVISSFIVVLGLLLAVLGAVVLSSVERDSRLVEQMQQEGRLREVDAQRLQNIIIENAIGYLIVGAVSTISGIGLLLRRRWARWLLLVLFTALLCLFAVQTARGLWNGVFDSRSLFGNLLVAGVISSGFWYFCRRQTISYLAP
jgi:hypothetical protein